MSIQATIQDTFERRRGVLIQAEQGSRGGCLIIRILPFVALEGLKDQPMLLQMREDPTHPLPVGSLADAERLGGLVFGGEVLAEGLEPLERLGPGLRFGVAGLVEPRAEALDALHDLGGRKGVRTSITLYVGDERSRADPQLLGCGAVGPELGPEGLELAAFTLSPA